MEKEILTIAQAAAYLQIGKRSLYRLAREGKIPGKRILNKWRFERESLKNWVGERERGLTIEDWRLAIGK